MIQAEQQSRGEKEIAFWRAHTTGWAPRFVYVITDPTCAAKVGVARNPSARLTALQCGNPRPLTLSFALPGSYDLESYLHSRAQRWRVQGEWFEGRGLADLMGEVERISAAMIDAHTGCGKPPHFKQVVDPTDKPTNWRTKRHDRFESPVTVRYVPPEPPSDPDPRGTHPLARRRISPSCGFGN